MITKKETVKLVNNLLFQMNLAESSDVRAGIGVSLEWVMEAILGEDFTRTRCEDVIALAQKYVRENRCDDTN